MTNVHRPAAPLAIPEDALTLARDVAMRRQSTRASVEAAAPLIVAAELERLAETYRPLMPVGEYDPNVRIDDPEMEAVRSMCSVLRRRAAELRAGLR